jgi:hypothetical protein
MRRSQLVLVALTAVFAFVAMNAVSASAAQTTLLALWLFNSTNVEAPLNIEAEGELTLEDTKGGLTGGAATVLCSGILDGTVNPESLGYISEVLTLGTTKELIETTPLVELGLECTNLKECTTPLVWAVGLPWESELELVEEGTEILFVNLILGNATAKKVGYLVQCMGVITEPEDECIAEQGAAVLSLEGATLLAAFTEAIRILMGLPLANCTRGGALTGKVISDEPFGALKDEAAGELSASSEGKEA